ncbi:MAG: DUF721 domain-containing protein [Proteobacteria bacterium]|nr:DUF721 domain-containing protein [Pseudomonadota bacterium]
MIESLGSIIKDFFRKLQIEPQLKEGRVLAGFPQILDPDLVGEVFPERVEKGVLYLQARSSAGMNELKLRQKSLIKRANDLLGEKFVSEIRISLSNPGEK